GCRARRSLYAVGRSDGCSVKKISRRARQAREGRNKYKHLSMSPRRDAENAVVVPAEAEPSSSLAVRMTPLRRRDAATRRPEHRRSFLFPTSTSLRLCASILVDAEFRWI